ncbi:3-hydroxyphenylacetate 6 hydroxylase [Microdochium bolleyi]|uniref:3-hydroxyphenylacetate 6 hydroxylase n=1 Tax=Microdochium bolleyi TaxID=196109 RepID=A0A136IPG2_9PEZI|nr:3-hydroxyphenylacetate 6 hydroxylase [Microdochium bolleyi]
MTIASFLLDVLEHCQDSPLKSLAAGVAAVPVVYILVNEVIRYNARFDGLKSPPGFPLIGHLWQLRGDSAQKYREWSKTYGDVFQIQLGNIPIVVINSAVAAKAIVAGNSQALSSRPEFYTFHKIVSDTSGTTIGTSPYSESLKLRRRGVAAALNRPSVATYVPLLDAESREFLRALYTAGNGGATAVDAMPAFLRLALSLGLTLNWGVRVEGAQAHLFEEITHVEDQLSRMRSTSSLSNLQDYIPLLRLNPFSGHSAKARDLRARRDRYLHELNDGLDARIAAGTHKPCIQANVLTDPDSSKLTKKELDSISLTMLGGGLDTVGTAVAWFVCLMSQRPHEQDKALREIRKVYGDDEPLCDASDDQQKCPYVVILIKELLRYYCVLRLNLPRASVKDIEYNGITLPAGTVFFLNAWACNNDPTVWSDPEVFRPERWLEQPDAPSFFYGIGYRMCPGYMLANRELYLLIIRLLSAFEIRKHEDVDSTPLTGNADPSNLVAPPPRAKVYFVPRNEKALVAALGSEKSG